MSCDILACHIMQWRFTIGDTEHVMQLSVNDAICTCALIRFIEHVRWNLFVIFYLFYSKIISITL